MIYVMWGLCALVMVLCGIAMLLMNRYNPDGSRRGPNGERMVKRPLPGSTMTVEADVDDPTDPMHDPACRAMFAEVLRTGRPMTMNRGEAPRFVVDVSDHTSCEDRGEK
jgi:hypothetical protein